MKLNENKTASAEAVENPIYATYQPYMKAKIWEDAIHS